MASKFDCESSVFNSFLVKGNSIYNEVDPDVNFFQGIPSFDTKHYSPPDFNKVLKTSLRMQFLFFMSILEMWKRTLTTLEIFYYALDFRFSIICFSETWDDDGFGKNSLYQLKTYKENKIRNGHKGVSSVSLFMNLFVKTFTKICALIIMTLNHLL